MNAFVVLKIVLVIDLYFYVRDDQKHIVEAKSRKHVGTPFQSLGIDELPFLHRGGQQNFEQTDPIDSIDDSDVVPKKLMKRKSKKLTKEQLANEQGYKTKRKGKKKKLHKKKKITHSVNSTGDGKGPPFDIVVHIKVNEK